VSFSLKKHEILRSKKSIKELFNSGSSFILYPFKVQYLPDFNSPNNQVLFSVSKRNFKKAVDRNLLRRRIREAYRLNKSLLLADEKEASSISIALIYIGKFKLPYAEIEDKLKQVLVRLNKTKYQK
jgi:ribonuclease P protein component